MMNKTMVQGVKRSPGIPTDNAEGNQALA